METGLAKVGLATFSGYEDHIGSRFTCPVGTVYDLQNRGCICAPGGKCLGPRNAPGTCRTAPDPNGVLLDYYDPSCDECMCDPGECVVVVAAAHLDA